MGDVTRRRRATISHRIPVVTSSEPLWAERETLPVPTGLRSMHANWSFRPSTEAHPDCARHLPTPSIWPLLAALAVGGHLPLLDLHAMGGRLGAAADHVR